MKPSLWLALAALAFSSCADNGVDVPFYSEADYSIDQYRSCYCPNAGVPMRVFVKADTIVAVMSLAGDTVLRRSSWGAYRSIKQLYDEIASFQQSLTCIVAVTIDSTNTYPARASFRHEPYIPDVNFTYVTWNFVELRRFHLTGISIPK